MMMTLLVTLCVALGAQTPLERVSVQRVLSPEKALRFEVTVPASLDAVWEAFTTKKGLETWLWRDARVDPRAGGDWLVLYPGGKSGGGTILFIEPRRRLIVAALAPEQFPAVRDQRTRAIFEFEEVAPGRTKITLEQTGWRTGPEWDKAYDYLAGGNATLLASLYRRFATGPVDWSK